MNQDEQPAAAETPQADKTSADNATPDAATDAAPKEFGGRKGPEPTRYGDWESKGICSDF